MALRSYSDFAPRVQAVAAMCPQAVVIDHIRRAAIEVCERTLMFRMQTTLNLNPNVFEYSYPNVPASTQVCAVFEAFINDRQLERLTLEQALERNPKWADVTKTDDASEPRILSELTPEKFVVLPMPDDSKTYTLRVFYALKPTRASTGLEEFIFNELEDAIFHHTLQNLLLVPNEPWTDGDLAAYHAKQYLFKLSERRARANVGTMRGSMSVRMRPFA
jgi:hypothetical protein